MSRFRKTPKALAEDASCTERSFEDLERDVFATITFNDVYEGTVSTRLARHFENAQTRVMVYAIARVDTDTADAPYWESSVEDLAGLETFRACFSGYWPHDEPERIELEDFLGALANGARDTDARLFGALIHHLQRIHYAFSLYKQSAAAERDPRQIRPDSTLASIASLFGHRVQYQIIEYTVVVDLTLTRFRNNEALETAAAARLLALESTPRQGLGDTTSRNSVGHRHSSNSNSGSGSGRPRALLRLEKVDEESDATELTAILLTETPSPAFSSTNAVRPLTPTGLLPRAVSANSDTSSGSSSSSSSIGSGSSDDDDVILTTSDPPHFLASSAPAAPPGGTTSSSTSERSAKSAGTSSSTFIKVPLSKKNRDKKKKQ